jgi:hypothetical protein
MMQHAWSLVAIVALVLDAAGHIHIDSLSASTCFLEHVRLVATSCQKQE